MRHTLVWRVFFLILIGCAGCGAPYTAQPASIPRLEVMPWSHAEAGVVGMPDRAAFLRRLPRAPGRRPGGEPPDRGSVSFVGDSLASYWTRLVEFNASRKASMTRRATSGEVSSEVIGPETSPSPTSIWRAASSRGESARPAPTRNDAPRSRAKNRMVPDHLPGGTQSRSPFSMRRT